MAISHGFNKTEAATSVTAPVTVNSGLQIVVGTAPVNMLDDPEAAVNTPLLVNTFKEAAAAVYPVRGCERQLPGDGHFPHRRGQRPGSCKCKAYHRTVQQDRAGE